MKPTSKDPRLHAKRAKQDFGTLLGALTDPSKLQERLSQEGETAEATLLALLFHLASAFVEDEGQLGRLLRQLVARLSDPKDPVRRAIKPSQWQVLWPTLNTLAVARTEKEADDARRKEEADPHRAGPGNVGPVA